MRNLVYTITLGFFVSLPIDASTLMYRRYAVPEGFIEPKREGSSPFQEKPILSAVLRREDLVPVVSEKERYRNRYLGKPRKIDPPYKNRGFDRRIS